MSNHRPSDEIVTLAARLADGELGEIEQEFLRQHLEASPADAVWFVEWMELNAMLQLDLGSMSQMSLTTRPLLPAATPKLATASSSCEDAVADHANTPARDRPLSRNSLTRPMVWFAIAGCLLLAATFLFGYSAARLRGLVAEESAAAERVDDSNAELAIATISGGVDAEFGDGITLGSRVGPGRLTLNRGVAQIVFDKGAVIVLEGPAELELVDSGACRLISGSISADVLPDAGGFSVDAGDFKVMEFDARFGMRRSPRADTEVHVFGGDLSLVGFSGPVAERRRLAEGEALRLHRDDTVTGIAYDPASFVTQQDFSRRRQINDQLAHARWAKYSTRWLKDPSVVLRYEFNPSSDGVAINTVDPARHAAKYRQLTPRWIEGRWSDKSSMLFDGRTDELLVEDHPELRFDRQMSVAVWFRERAHSWGPWARLVGKGLGTDRNYGLWIDMRGNLLWQVCPETDPESQDVWDRYSLHGGKLAAGKWHLVVGVVDEDELRVYVNGRMQASGPAPEKIATSDAPLTIGFYDEVPHHNSYFCGEIDEVVLLNRAMTDKEVSEMYEAGKPEYTPAANSDSATTPASVAPNSI